MHALVQFSDGNATSIVPLKRVERIKKSYVRGIHVLYSGQTSGESGDTMEFLFVQVCVCLTLHSIMSICHWKVSWLPAANQEAIEDLESEISEAPEELGLLVCKNLEIYMFKIEHFSIDVLNAELNMWSSV